jgi:hypothetical protein
METWCDPRIRVGHEKTRVIWWKSLELLIKGNSCLMI